MPRPAVNLGALSQACSAGSSPFHCEFWSSFPCEALGSPLAIWREQGLRCFEMLAEAFWGVMVCSVPARTQGTGATAPGGARGSEETPRTRRLLNLKSAKLHSVFLSKGNPSSVQTFWVGPLGCDVGNLGAPFIPLTFFPHLFQLSCGIALKSHPQTQQRVVALLFPSCF